MSKTNHVSMKRPAFEYAKEIEHRIVTLNESEYLSRPRKAKRLIEELYPLSRLALSVQQPGLCVEVEGFENPDFVDGHIWVSGFKTEDFDVEVTFAGYGYRDALRAELLVEKRCVPGAGSIWRDKKTGKIEAKMEAEDMDAHIKKDWKFNL